MGNKQLRPDPTDPFAPFGDDQKAYLKEKYDSLCDQKTNKLSSQKIVQELRTSKDVAESILNYIDFQGKGEVDFYEFMCAAASLHQDDEQAQQFLFDLFKANEKQLNRQSVKSFFSTVFSYLKFMDLINEDYDDKIGEQKFKQYDYNKNETIGLDEFRSLLVNDFHCSLWMQTLGFAAEREVEKKEKPLNHEIEKEDFAEDDETGDQAGSTPSWKGTIKYMTDQPIVKRSNPPNQKLDIDYIYGYRSYDTRSNLRYNRNNEIVYHTAGCGIILNKLKKTQKINTEHNDDITCLDINSKKALVATGELGRKPAIVIWDANTAQTKAVFQSKLEHSIGCIAISPSGRYVAASSMSDNHEIAVYDITEKALVAFGKGPRFVIYQIKFNSEEDTVICACAKEVVFAYFSKGKLQCKKGVFGKAPCIPCYSIATLKNNECIISMQNGLLTLWKGNSCSKLFKEHSKAVISISQRESGGIISGDAEGNIILWSAQMVVERSFDLKKLYKSNNPRIISVYEQFGNILVGTRGGQIIEIQIEKNNVRLLMEGHFDEELWGLAVSSSKHEFFTGGQDKLLMKWDILQKKCIEKKKLDGQINCLDLSRNNQLAVGMKNGVVHIFQASSLKLTKSFYKHKNPDKDMISVVKFSPDGNKLAVAYAPPYSCVYIFDLNEADSKAKSLSGSPSRINSIDFTRNGQAILVNNTSYQILFYDATSSQQKKAMTPSNFKGEEWTTLTARFSWATQGIWPPCSDGSDINTVDRSNSKKFIATGDDFSKVKIFDYPACQQKQINNAYKGHSSHITGVKWSFDDKYLISTGGLEKSIIQWSNTVEQEVNYDFEDVPETKDKKQKVEDNQHDDDYEYNQLDDQKEVAPKKEKKKDDQDQDSDFTEESDDQGDQSLAVKPFLGQVKASTPAEYAVASQPNVPPAQDLTIKHVWGIRNLYISDRVRNQLRYSADFKSCLFMTAALGVQMDLETKKQSFYKGQSEDLISFDISKDRKYCATGQMAQLNKNSPKNKIIEVHVWDVQTKTKLKVLSKFHQRAVYLVSFSPSGQKILTVGQDDKNSLAVYDWKNQRISFSAPVDGAKVCDAAWKNENEFVTCGLKHVKFWSGAKGSMGKISGNGGKWDPMLSAICWNDKYVTGGTSGTIYLWSGGNGVPCVGHKSRVDCFGIDHAGNLYSGDSQGKILSWKLTGGKLVMEKEIFNAAQIDKIDPGILSIDFSPDKKMLICTNSSSIYEIAGKQTKTIMKSHCKGELWGEAWSPDSKQFVTGGDDMTLRIFDAITYEELHCYQMKEQIRGVDWEQSSGELIVAGDYRGNIHLFNTKLEKVSEQSFKTMFRKTKPKKEPYWIEDIKFSPNGKMVAFGAHGGPSHIEIYDIEGGKQFKNPKKINGLFSSALLSLDWDQASQIIAGVSLAYELNFANANTKQKVSAASVKNVKWASWSSKFGYQSKQVHQDVDYSNINTVCVNPSKTLVATGGDDQKIRLFKYPVIIPKQKNKQYIGQSSHVTKVRFSPDESFLLSIGGNDRTIILWELKGANKIVKEKIEEDEQQEEEDVEVEGDENEGDDQEEFQQIRVPRKKQDKKPIATKKQSVDFESDDDEGDQFMATKPWLGAIKQPTGPFYKSTGKAPPVDLEIEFAHGYRTKDCRNNLRYVGENCIAYHTAGLGVLMDTKDRTQAFFDDHSDDVISFYQHKSNRSVIYTSEMGDKPSVFAWKAQPEQQPEKIKEFKGARKGVSAVIGNGKYVVAACLDDNHEVFVWNYETGKYKSEKGGRDVIIAMDWVSQNQFVTVGVKHYKLWKVDPLKGETGSFGKNNNILCCVSVKDGKIYAGASDGALQIWSGRACSKSISLHNKAPLNALWIGDEILMTGGGDKKICILKEKTLQVIQKVDCQKIIKDSVKLSICSLDVWKNKILAGTLGSEIYEIKAAESIENIDENTKISLEKKLMSGHYAPNKVTNEVWGLTLYLDQFYITCSDDGTVRIWDLQSKEEHERFSLDVSKQAIGKPKNKIQPKQNKALPDSAKGRCICSNEEGWIVVGCKDGTVKIFDNEFTLKFTGLMNSKKKEISQVKFSPDGRLLAVGDHLGFIYVFAWNDGQIKKKHAKIKHNSYIKHFDFSRDSNTIHSTCGAYELLFWDAQTGAQKKSGATETKNEEWSTWSTTLGWPVQGIFEATWDGTDVNAVDRSNEEHCKPMMKLLASGDDKGKVRVLEYPCTIPKSSSVKGKGHSSHVTNVKFTRDDKVILSTGGQDQTVIQWRCEPSDD